MLNFNIGYKNEFLLSNFCSVKLRRDFYRGREKFIYSIRSENELFAITL